MHMKKSWISHELSRNRKKVVSSCFRHCNANTNKYMHVLAMRWIYIRLLGCHRHTHTQRLREKPRECVHWMRAHFYVNCIRSANSMHAAWCMFTMHVVLAKPVPRVIKAHKNLHACVDNNFSLLCCMSGEWARALVRERATCLHLTYWQVLG